jgi:hypothetical protein
MALNIYAMGHYSEFVTGKVLGMKEICVNGRKNTLHWGSETTFGSKTTELELPRNRRILQTKCQVFCEYFLPENLQHCLSTDKRQRYHQPRRPFVPIQSIPIIFPEVRYSPTRDLNRRQADMFFWCLKFFTSVTL